MALMESVISVRNRAASLSLAGSLVAFRPAQSAFQFRRGPLDKGTRRDYFT